jgi:hypothetical protein
MSRRSVKFVLLAMVLAALAAAALSNAEVTRKGNLQLTLTGELSPTTLPRSGAAPIAVTVGGKITTTDGSPPPRLKTLTIDLNNSGEIESKGLPVCAYSSIQPGSSSRALNACRASLVGKGTFNAEITLAGQKPYPTGGRMLLFNGKEGGKNVLFGHIYAAHPFATSFVIVFKIGQLGKGPFGTSLAATLPPSLLNWGNITGIEMKLQRTFTTGGKHRSYLSAGCPTPKGVPRATFPLTKTTFGFDDGRSLSSTLVRSCKATGK